ncbi:MAG: tRNA dimethylallyltransferase [Candidatus Peribacter riflensis]|uniref:tRNA dimethylallyltransferase n=1 Tax=Candidatus Peribacter riflensis TaxID=1735162 RepID=A0A0S1STC0_9BACT|nr:MAG: tRNA dimethylallyltransferase [Candidatus Peribacter riflensis]OGJ79286.1 MAG: tRNA (adenosine(37)-N6)-dimethylallyltransferase MiaA [Candidatus Peribacteria bacterium RIFOXYB1_FULL_57_12]OGJ82479.1 MAG: tRNA (adenosine(37)-N6)-dimethylallyltransferase MiaA [Candidatus Peribacteria bacterium RIFOXYC1_FULL_58_8]ALM10966.1 MAG: tRNA dimethylallyltransferase [Candidatus Peribacter riflensis]ALM12069.1 MAG: tRNA dimethylallyltransferase [Candidatus Peribacter riflensis]
METSIITDIGAFLTTAKRPLLVLVGPTASGKTALSISLAHALSEEGKTVEIINADSRQLYRALDIGTAKIRTEDMQGIPHHLLDQLDPKKEVTAAWYKREAERVIGEIRQRAHVPFLVGGSMLYVSAIVDHLAFVDRADPSLRKTLRKRLQTEGPAALFAELQELDPEGALSVDPRNSVYLLRALEVCLVTGRTLKHAKKKNTSSDEDLFFMGLALPREELHRRIAARTEAMFAEGFVEEVSSLLQHGYSAEDPGMQSHGYRDIAERLQKASVEEVRRDAALKQAITAKARQYARRQMTWWREDERIRWIAPSPIPQPGALHHPLPGGEGRQ